MDLPNFLFDLVLLCEHTLALCAKVGTVFLMSSLLYIAHFRKAKLRVHSLSPCMQLYLAAHTVCSALGIPYVFYKLFWALPRIWFTAVASAAAADNQQQPYDDAVPYYSPYVLFWTGIVEISYITAAPCLVTLVALERCIILKCSANMNVSWPRILLFGVGFFTFVALWSSTFIVYLQELPLQLDKVFACKTTSCQTIRTLSIHSVGPKVVVGLINIVCCIGFLRMLRSVGPSVNLKNRVVKFTIFTEIFLNALPALGALLFNKITGLVMANYVGELSISACPIDAFICAMIYWKILVKKGNGGSAIGHQHHGTVAPVTANNKLMIMMVSTIDRRVDRRQTIK